MPKIVDVEERRATLAEAAWRTIVRHGISGATTRQLAEEAGVTRGLLFHYFKDKDDVIETAWALLQDRFRDRLAAGVAQAADSVEVLRAMAYSNLPIDEQRRLEFGVWLNMWAHGFSSDSLRLEQQRLYEGWRNLLAGAVRTAIDDGLLRPDVDPMIASTQLAGLTDGLIVQLLVDPEHPHVTDYATRAVDDLIDRWTLPSRRPRSNSVSPER